ncbi:hypothetical protein [Natrinema caseinilyticum]|uniref:hypothetical protein n=1 Tax=Natrinema caseinilyticum TaxID=2961570 RepID=UPI0020C4AAE4|nr:hypothetical protein [Natrinema caseinilyticum]
MSDDQYATPILDRHDELTSISKVLEPALYDNRTGDVSSHGPRGVEKTASVRWMLRDRRRRASVNAAIITSSDKAGFDIVHGAIDTYLEEL